ncbi:hypothetical protein HDU85_004872 [Gaertneriomyces sp. JEL0708]|nr:hypothetical protein HDU85_004872 [Gaertneriomyces sp. JEL0708]
MDPDVCPPDHDAKKLAFGSFITIGLLVSYLPQIAKIISIQSSEGLSVYFLFLGSIGMLGTVGNMALLQFPSVMCCTKWTPWLCFENTLGLTQVTVQTACFMTCTLLYYIYFPPAKKHRLLPATDPADPPVTQLSYQWKHSLRLAGTVVVYALLVSIAVSAILMRSNGGRDMRAAELFAGFLGLLAMVTSFLQFFPQILHTWRAKSVGALSIPTMLMQCPGSFLFVYSLSIQPGASWTSWLPYFVSGTLQGMLLTLSIWYSYHEPHERLIDEEESRQPLLDQEGDADGSA